MSQRNYWGIQTTRKSLFLSTYLICSPGRTPSQTPGIDPMQLKITEANSADARAPDPTRLVRYARF